MAISYVIFVQLGVLNIVGYQQLKTPQTAMECLLFGRARRGELGGASRELCMLEIGLWLLSTCLSSGCVRQPVVNIEHECKNILAMT